MNESFEDAYKKWCNETKRNGGILIGASIREFISILQVQKEKDKQTIDKLIEALKEATDIMTTYNLMQSKAGSNIEQLLNTIQKDIKDC